MSLKFDESENALSIRIEAHRKYSTLKIEDVLGEIINDRFMPHILDVGCGVGNFSPLLATKCNVYVGLDKGTELLHEAKNRCDEKHIENALFMKFDMDDRFPFQDETFDFVLFAYSAYYVENSEKLLSDVKRVMRNNSKLCLIGPSRGLAPELDFISEKIFGCKASHEKNIRAERIEKEFYPLVQNRLKNAHFEEKDFSLQFPNWNEYCRYYLATPQYIELVKLCGYPEIEIVENAVKDLKNLTVTKKAVFLTAEKR